ncbi:putative chromate transport protein [Fundidesulfovibrio magnetotacticus]|uniref:Putative chromate transport protein n=1 Tax=Fundidesulfovibrio magnetotacticus TaxID=2730080 RepID=A0A6V8M0L0_9BACT|nr:chromate efflux transporter [Fundidesulfovibrio magnetotacticus]GFK95397.1 putative chromate transport protein [Fundidesulfovibrio magnetotacticus]
MPPRTSLWTIFKSFFIVGATAYGGPAMMPMMRREAVEKRGFVSREEFRLGLGLCQLIPGGTLMQLAAYIGLKLRGLWGALAAYAGFSAPAFLLMLGLSSFYMGTRNAPLAQAVYMGLKVVVLAICLMSCLDFVKRFAPTRRHQAFTAGAAALFLGGAGIVPIVGGAAVLGMLFLDPGPAPDAGEGPEGDGALRLAVIVGLVQLACLGALYVWDRLLFQLAVSMIKVDMLAFGGFGVFPVMYAEVVEYRGWIDESTFIEGMALAQVTPGPSLLASAFMGYMVRGVPGALVGAIGVFAASFVVVLAASHYRGAIIGSRRARQALSGVLATLGGMIVAVSWTLSKAVAWDWRTALILALSLGALAARVAVYWVVLGAAALAALIC